MRKARMKVKWSHLMKSRDRSILKKGNYQIYHSTSSSENLQNRNSAEIRNCFDCLAKRKFELETVVLTVEDRGILHTSAYPFFIKFSR